MKNNYVLIKILSWSMHVQDRVVGVNFNDEGKKIVKEVTQVSGHSIKLHFCTFEK